MVENANANQNLTEQKVILLQRFFVHRNKAHQSCLRGSGDMAVVVAEVWSEGHAGDNAMTAPPVPTITHPLP